MNPDTSPFMPGQTATAKVFTGRKDHIDDLLASVRVAKRGNLAVSWIGGERGIGKSSLAAFAGAIAEQEESALFAHVHLGDAESIKDIAHKSYLSLLQDNRGKSFGKRLFDMFADRVQKVGFYGAELELRMKDGELPSTLDQLAHQLAGIAKQTKAKAIVLAMDDINGIAEVPKFAHSIKSMIDGLAGRQHIPLCMFFVGLDERLDAMRNNNPSVMRCFRPLLRLQLWSKEDSANFFRRTFQGAGASIDDEDIGLLADLCGGMPTIAHELGDAIWWSAGDKNITNADVLGGVFIATDSIGSRFLKPEIIKALQSNIYRSILGKIATKLDVQFTKKELLAPGVLTDSEKKGLANFLKRMRELGGIIPAEGERGVYRFPSEIHRFYYQVFYYQVEGGQWILPTGKNNGN